MTSHYLKPFQILTYEGAAITIDGLYMFEARSVHLISTNTFQASEIGYT